MNRTRKFAKNVMVSALTQVLALIGGFLLPKIMLKYFGSEINGLVTSITQVMTYLALLEAGLSGASTFALYKPLTQEDTTEISRVVNATKQAYYKVGYVLLSLSVFASLAYAFLIKTSLLSRLEVAALFLIIALNTVVDFFALAKYRSLLAADQKYYVISLSTTIQTVVNVAIIWALAAAGLGIVWVRLVALCSLLTRSLILVIYCKKHYRYLDRHVEGDPALLNKRWDALFLQILGTVHRGAPILIATVMLTLNDVSIYSIYNMVFSGLATVLSIFTTGLQSSFGDVLAREEYDTFKASYEQFETMYYLVTTIMYSVAFVTIIPFIRVYTANADIDYIFPVLGAMFSINEYLFCIKNPQGMTVIAAGLYRETRWQALTQALICIIGGIVACHFLGLYGILIGRICSNVYRDIDLLFFIPRQYRNLNIGTTFKKLLVNFGCFVLAIFLGELIPSAFVQSYLTWVAYACIVGIVCLTVVFVPQLLLFRNDIVKTLQKLHISKERKS